MAARVLREDRTVRKLVKQEVEPHQTERPPRDASKEDTPDKKSGVKCNIQPDRGGVTA
jgi:hypothetical protein